ncbi:hypothetical protein Sdagh_29840 [Streptomyces daghestanicus]|uniref:Uncharacterized protein n=1 Tax=Streptomyces daghestanicus TaxID=66885 RepID=A0ABQ3Q1Y0_9ACTN|nr:hypothetical protein Sdagh_29840 [Streptomyces daghestanicus]
MSSSSSRERWGKSGLPSAIVLWTDLVRIGSYMDGLLTTTRKPSYIGIILKLCRSREDGSREDGSREEGPEESGPEERGRQGWP